MQAGFGGGSRRRQIDNGTPVTSGKEMIAWRGGARAPPFVTPPFVFACPPAPLLDETSSGTPAGPCSWL